MKNYQYRKIYESALHIEIEKDFAIHHIDFNRENNDITNLVALPRGLHNKYHLHLNILRQIRPFEPCEELASKSIDGLNVEELELEETTRYFQYLKRFLLCKIECFEYILKRNQLIEQYYGKKIWDRK
jgi:CRISPR/Cas system CSM-associated protein Csm2 small subunit